MAKKAHLFTDSSWLKAREARDPRYDGLFYTAYPGPRLFCRSICASPDEAGSIVFATAWKALAEGFQPCPLCRPESAPAVTLDPPLLARAIARMDAEPGLSLPQLAAHLGTEAEILEHVFLRDLDLSVQTVGWCSRLLLGLRLLSETGLSLVTIALACGYPDQASFAAAFTGLFKQSPEDARQKRNVENFAKENGAPLEMSLAYRPPYNWEMVLGFLAGRRIPGVELIEDQTYAATFRLAGAQGWFKLSHQAEQHSFGLTLALDRPERVATLLKKIRLLLDLDANPLALAEAFGADPIQGPRLARNPGVRLPGSRDPFEFSIRAVLGQQISVRAATTLAGRIGNRYGQASQGFPAGLDVFFPNALELKGETFEGLGLTNTRAQTLQTLVTAVAEGQTVLDAGGDVDRFEKDFCTLKGIGPWTASYVAMRGLGEKDAFPESDLGVLKALSGPEKRISPKQALAQAEVWRPYRAYAAILLWTQESLGD